MSEFKAGDRICTKSNAESPGTVLNPAEVGLAATEGTLVRWDDGRRTDENAGSLQAYVAPPPAKKGKDLVAGVGAAEQPADPKPPTT